MIGDAMLENRHNGRRRTGREKLKRKRPRGPSVRLSLVHDERPFGFDFY